MIDIHSHIVFGVDDGALTIGDSIRMIEEEIKQGVHTILCTPHFRSTMFEASHESIIENFNILKKEVMKRNLKVELYLAREIYYTKSTFERLLKKEFLSYPNPKYYLVEFDYFKKTDIAELCYTMYTKNMRMVVAHIERYAYLKTLDEFDEILSSRGLIQVNASTICGADGYFAKRKVMKLIKYGYVSFVGSDIHFNRINYMEKAYTIIKKKFGEEVADDLFENNAKNYLLGK